MAPGRGLRSVAGGGALVAAGEQGLEGSFFNDSCEAARGGGKEIGGLLGLDCLDWLT